MAKQQLDMTFDFQWGSCGKGGVSGYLALRNPYTAVVCAYGTQAGHSYNNKSLGIKMVTQQLPVGIISHDVRDVFIGPGALIHAGVLRAELERFAPFLKGKRVFIHENAAVVTDDHAAAEVARGQTKMGSTAKGVGQAAIDRILRNPDNPAVVRHIWAGTDLEVYVANKFEYMAALMAHDRVLIEGAQGFGLSIYHGAYPYTTSRDVTPWQLAADCALPWDWANDIRIIGAARTYPIRVNNRDGTSGPGYFDQNELEWQNVGVDPELTTVTKLPRRIFEFSPAQTVHASIHCGIKNTSVALTFADYCKTSLELLTIARKIRGTGLRISHAVYGPDDSDVVELPAGVVEQDLVMAVKWEEHRGQGK